MKDKSDEEFWDDVEDILNDPNTVLMNGKDCRNHYNTFDILSEDRANSVINLAKYKHFMFKVDPDSDVLCSFQIDEDLYALCAYYKSDTQESWKDIHRGLVEDHLSQESSWSIFTTEVPFYGYDISRSCKEFPYVVYIVGSDDASYQRCFATEGDMNTALNIIQDFYGDMLDAAEYVRIHNFVFTN